MCDACNSINRRQFLARGGAATAAGGMLLGALRNRPLTAASRDAGWPAIDPVKIFTVFGGPEYPLSPHKEPVKRFQQHLAALQKRLRNATFTGGEFVRNAQEGQKAAEALGNADALLAFGVHQASPTGLQPILDKCLASGLPIAVFNEPFSGLHYALLQQWRQAHNAKMPVLSTSDFDEIERVAGLLRVPGLLRKTRILLIGRLDHKGQFFCDGTAPARDPKNVKEALGVEIIEATGQDAREAYDSVDVEAAEQEAEQYWIKPAAEVVAPRRDVVGAARMYLALKNLMIAANAHALTIHCLSALSRRMMDVQGYPCLAFSKLDDIGLASACQADMDDMLTKLIVQYALGLPGMIANAYFDVGGKNSKNVLLYDHCTAPTLMHGQDGERLPFVVTTHHTNTGAAPDVEFPVGQTVTVAKLVELRTMLHHAGKVVENPKESVCRTAVALELPDIQKTYENWVSLEKGEFARTGNLVETVHRVIFFGDHQRSLKDLARLMALRDLEE